MPRGTPEGFVQWQKRVISTLSNSDKKAERGLAAYINENLRIIKNKNGFILMGVLDRWFT